MKALPYVDLHIHTYHSDGGMSPREVVESAVENGVGLLAVADHDVTGGSLEIAPLCRERGISLIPAVEIDSLEDGINFHILGYGVDFENRAFTDFLAHTRGQLDRMSDILLGIVAETEPRLSLEDFETFTYDRTLGGWKALHYFMAKGLTGSLEEGIRFYGEYGVGYETSGFPSIREVCQGVKAAGGYPVLAHPGELLDTSDTAAFVRELRRLIPLGLEGIECYYPTHSPAITQACVDLCREMDLYITAGSDCHGIFGRTRVGEPMTTEDKLHLFPIKR